MADAFASLADEFLATHLRERYASEVDYQRHLYRFLAEKYPNLELTKATVEHLAWSISMRGSFA